MKGLQALEAVQYITAKDRRWAVVDLNDWEALIEWLETVEDTGVARKALKELREAGGDRERAGWLPWDEVRERV